MLTETCMLNKAPRSHEILMFFCLQKDAKLKLSCNPNLPQAAPDFRIGGRGGSGSVRKKYGVN